MSYIWEVKLKKLRILLIVLLLALFIVPIQAKADMFEKPSVIVEVIGLDQPYSFEFLIHKPHRGEVLEEEEYERANEFYYNDKYPLHIFNGYKDDDGYVARTLYNSAPAFMVQEDTHAFKNGYHSVPSKFKIAIVLEDDTLITSEVINKKLYRSEMTFDLTDVNLNGNLEGVGVVKEELPLGHISWRFVLRVIVTILIELLILGLFMYRRRKSFLLVGVTNLVTQTILTIFMFLSYYSWSGTFGLIFILVIGEALVFLTEMIFYSYTLKEQQRSKAVIYGFVANLATLIISIFTLWFI